MKDETRLIYTGQEAIDSEAMRHFKTFYADTGQNIIVDQMKAICNITPTSSLRDVQELEKPCSIE
jgi:hypothetical protein